MYRHNAKAKGGILHLCQILVQHKYDMHGENACPAM